MRLTMTQATSASAGELRQAMYGLGRPPAPSLTLTWRGRAGVRVLDGAFTSEVVTGEAGRSVLTCRYRVGGPFARPICRDARQQLRGNLQYIAAAICHRAEELHAASSDGRPPPAVEAGGPSGPHAHTERGAAA